MNYRNGKALTGDFAFRRKRKPAVPVYADGLRLPVFGAFFLFICIIIHSGRIFFALFCHNSQNIHKIFGFQNNCITVSNPL